MDPDKGPVSHSEELQKNEGEKRDIGDVPTGVPRGRPPRKNADNVPKFDTECTGDNERKGGGSRSLSEHKTSITFRVEADGDVGRGKGPDVHDSSRINKNDTSTSQPGASHPLELAAPDQVYNSVPNNVDASRGTRVVDSGNGARLTRDPAGAMFFKFKIDGTLAKVIDVNAEGKYMIELQDINKSKLEVSLSELLTLVSRWYWKQDEQTKLSVGYFMQDSYGILYAAVIARQAIVEHAQQQEHEPHTCSFCKSFVCASTALPNTASIVEPTPSTPQPTELPELTKADGGGSCSTVPGLGAAGEESSSIGLSHKMMRGIQCEVAVEDRELTLSSPPVKLSAVACIASSVPPPVDATPSQAPSQSQSVPPPMPKPSPASTWIGAAVVPFGGCLSKPDAIVTTVTEGERGGTIAPHTETLAGVAQPAVIGETNAAAARGKSRATPANVDTYYDFGGDGSSDFDEKYKDVPIKTPSQPLPPGTRRIRTTPARPRMTSGVASSGTQVVCVAAPANVQPDVSAVGIKAPSTYVSTEPLGESQLADGTSRAMRNTDTMSSTSTSKSSELLGDTLSGSTSNSVSAKSVSADSSNGNKHKRSSLSNDDTQLFNSSGGVSSETREGSSREKSKKRSADNIGAPLTIEDRSVEDRSSGKKKAKVTSDNADGCDHRETSSVARSVNGGAATRDIFSKSSVESTRSHMRMAAAEKKKHGEPAASEGGSAAGGSGNQGDVAVEGVESVESVKGWLIPGMFVEYNEHGNVWKFGQMVTVKDYDIKMRYLGCKNRYQEFNINEKNNHLRFAMPGTYKKTGWDAYMPQPL